MFNQAFIITMGYEGEYSNNKFDKGGETYMGISRIFHPNWNGWQLIDNIEDRTNKYILQEVKSFYKKHYWDKLLLDKVSLIIPNCSLELFDIAVNMGTNTSSKILQKSLNILNRDNDLISVDGWIGNETISGIDKYIYNEKESLLLKLIILMKAKRYINIVEKNTTQKIFIRGWLNRVQI